MKKAILLSVFLSASFVILYSEISAPPVDSAGAPPSNATCTRAGCHAGNTVEDATKFTLRLSETETGLADASSVVDESRVVIGGATYFGSLQLNGGANVFGFQLLALNGANAQAGFFEVTDAAHTQITTAGSRQYIGHKNASSTKVFNFKWTAPNSETTTFYYAAVFGNGNGQNTGDNIYNGKVTPNLGAVSINDIPSVENFNVYPTQTHSNVSVKLNSAKIQTGEITLVDMSGRTVKILYNGNLNVGENEFLFDISEVQQGNYVLSLQAGNAHTAKHIVKL